MLDPAALEARAFLLERGLLLQFNEPLQRWTQTVLSDLRPLSTESTDLADEAVTSGWGDWEGLEGTKWSLTEEQMRVLKQLSRKVLLLDEPLYKRALTASRSSRDLTWADPYEPLPYFADESVLSRMKLEASPALPRPIEHSRTGRADFHKLLAGLGCRAVEVEDDGSMDRLEERPEIEDALCVFCAC